MAFYIHALIFGGISALAALLGLHTTFALSPIFLFFAPLPIVYASLRYDYFCGLLAALFATIALTPLLHAPVAIAYLGAIALPAWFMGFLYMRAEPVVLPQSKKTAILWYPIGSIVAALAAISPCLVALSILFAPSFEAYQTMLLQFSKALLEASPASAELSSLTKSGDREQTIQILAQFLPVMAVMSWLIMQLTNLWLAARINLTKPEFPRPRPNFYNFALPRWFNIYFPIAFLLTFFQGFAGLMGTVGVVTGVLCFMLLGLSVIHVGTQGVRARRFILVAVYFFLLVQGWALLMIAFLGLVEHYAGLKRRFFTKEKVSRKQ